MSNYKNSNSFGLAARCGVTLPVGSWADGYRGRWCRVDETLDTTGASQGVAGATRVSLDSGTRTDVTRMGVRQ